MLTQEPLVIAGRLDRVTSAIGFALWQLQELEWAIAHYVVIRLHAKRGLSPKSGCKTLEEVGKRTFGSLLNELSAAGALEPKLVERLKATLHERNWLVHRSRREDRGVLNSEERCATLVAKLKCIAKEALALLRQVLELAEQQVVQSGVSEEAIDRETARLLAEWGILE
jgi:hypothetical protein